MKRTKYNNGNGNKNNGNGTTQASNGTMSRTIRRPGTYSMGKTQVEKARTEINYQEVLFVHEYLTDLDPGNAMIRARLCSQQASKKVADKLGLERLRTPRIREYLEKSMLARAERAQVTADRTLNEVAQIAFLDPIDAFHDNGELKQLKDMPKSTRCVISELEFKYNAIDKVSYPHKIKFYNKLEALQNLLKHLGLLSPEPGNTLNVNYIDRQYNTQQNTNINTLVNISNLTNDELRVIRKMVGEEEAHNLLDLHSMEEQIYASEIG